MTRPSLLASRRVNISVDRSRILVCFSCMRAAIAASNSARVTAPSLLASARLIKSRPSRGSRGGPCMPSGRGGRGGRAARISSSVTKPSLFLSARSNMAVRAVRTSSMVMAPSLFRSARSKKPGPSPGGGGGPCWAKTGVANIIKPAVARTIFKRMIWFLFAADLGGEGHACL